MKSAQSAGNERHAGERLVGEETDRLTNQGVRERGLRLPRLPQDGLGHQRPLRRLRTRRTGRLPAVLGRRRAGAAAAAAVPARALLAGGGGAPRDPGGPATAHL